MTVVIMNETKEHKGMFRPVVPKKEKTKKKNKRKHCVIIFSFIYSPMKTLFLLLSAENINFRSHYLAVHESQ